MTSWFQSRGRQEAADLESAEDVLQNAHVGNILEGSAQAGHQLGYQSCYDKDGRIATCCEVSLQGL